ncbi:MAG: YigZ family protein [Tahibacter sp.]
MSAALSRLAGPATLAQEIRKSRFVANAAPAGDPAAALAFLQQIADPQATHNCWAYRIGAQYRFSDDGEPGGTAGRPILQAIEGQACDQLMVVVTRWYGGIKLGAGGLVRAYGGCAAECLRQAPKIPLIDTIEVDFFLPFAALAIFKARHADWDARVLQEQFDAEGAHLRLSVPRPQGEELRRFLSDLTRGRIQWQVRD